MLLPRSASAAEAVVVAASLPVTRATADLVLVLKVLAAACWNQLLLRWPGAPRANIMMSHEQRYSTEDLGF